MIVHFRKDACLVDGETNPFRERAWQITPIKNAVKNSIPLVSVAAIHAPFNALNVAKNTQTAKTICAAQLVSRLPVSSAPQRLNPLSFDFR